MDPESKVASIEAQIESLLSAGKSITHKASAEKRGLTDEERLTIDSNLAEAKRLKPQLVQAREAAAAVKTARSKGGRVDGFGKAAVALVKGQQKYAGRLRDFVKDATVTDALAEATRREPGIAPLREDSRNLYSLLSSTDPGAGALHVEDFRVDARGLAAGSAAVERDPMAQTAKAEIDVSIDLASADMKQFAALISSIPNQAFESVPALQALLASALGRELAIALDAHVLAAIQAANPAAVSGGVSVFEQLARAVSDLKAAGGNADVAILPPDVLEEIALTPADQLPSGWLRDRFGIGRIIDSPAVNGIGYVADLSGAHLYRGSMSMERDSSSGFDTNESRVRAEYNALAVIREPAMFIEIDTALTS